MELFKDLQGRNGEPTLTEAQDKAKKDLLNKVHRKNKEAQRAEGKAADAFFKALAERAIWGHLDAAEGGTLKRGYDDSKSPEDNLTDHFIEARDGAKDVGFSEIFDDGEVWFADALDDVKMKL